MNARILPAGNLSVNDSNVISVAAGLGAQIEHDLFRAESLLSLITTSSGVAALTELDADQRQAILVTVAELVSSARNTAFAIEVLAD